MSYFEMDSVLFRGTLRGATGTAKFKLSAKKIEAVDTVNIAEGSVSWVNRIYKWFDTPLNRDRGQLLQTFQINVPEGHMVEISVSANASIRYKVDGVWSVACRGFRHGHGNAAPVTELKELSAGVHQLQVYAWVRPEFIDHIYEPNPDPAPIDYRFVDVLLRFIRKTGSAA